MIVPVSLLFFLISYLFLGSKQEQRVKSMGLTLVLIWIILTFIATFRPENMSDRENYLDFWNGWEGGRFEIGFTTITDIIRIISTNNYWFLFVFAALSISLKLFAIKRITNLFWASLLIYVANMFILHDMIQMRCAVASGLLLHAVYYLVNHDSKRFFITFILAFLFHYSSLIILPLFLLDVKRINKYFYIGLIFVSYMIGPIFPIESFIQMLPIEGVQSLWAVYENTVDDEINIFNAMQLGRIAICLFLLINIDKIFYHNKYAILLVKIYATSIVTLVLFSSVPVIAFRVSELYQVVEIVLIPMAMYALRGNVYFKRTILFIIGLAFLFMNIFYLELLK